MPTSSAVSVWRFPPEARGLTPEAFSYGFSDCVAVGFCSAATAWAFTRMAGA